MLSDAPAHHIFCLLGPCHPKSNQLPQILCVIQVYVQQLADLQVINAYRSVVTVLHAE